MSSNGAGIKNQNNDALLQLETCGTDTTSLNDAWTEKSASVVKFEWDTINDHLSRESVLLCICQQYGDSLETVHSALL